MRATICLAIVAILALPVHSRAAAVVGAATVEAQGVLRYERGEGYLVLVTPAEGEAFTLRLAVPDDKAVLDKLAALKESPVRVTGALTPHRMAGGVVMALSGFEIEVYEPAPQVTATGARNVALGKRVTSAQPHSGQYGRAEARLTDGNLRTDAYPGSMAVDYTIDLTVGRNVTAKSFDIESIMIDWGYFGRHFPGVKRPDGSWVPAAYKADYVNNYQVLYQTRGSSEWKVAHTCKSMPTHEDAANVSTTREPADASISEGEVQTTISNLDLRNVTAIRLTASGGHWVGVFEVCAFGRPAAAPAPTPTPPPVRSSPLEPAPSMEPAPTTAPVKE